MIKQPTFDVEPWRVTESTLELHRLAQAESVFALSNGHIGVRGTLDEGEPRGLPGTYLNGFYELRPLPYAEAGYGYPETGQTVVPVTNGKIIRLLVEDEPFDIRYGDLVSHERSLEMRDGYLRRVCHWVSPTGQAVKVRSIRLVSLVQRAIMAIQYEVEAVDDGARVVLQSELVANEPTPESASADPRVAAALTSPLVSEQYAHGDTRVTLAHMTRRSGLHLAAAMDHIVEGPPGTQVMLSECEEDVGRVTIASDLPPGEPLRLTKFVAYGWSAERSTPALRSQVEAALAEARHTGWDGLVSDQRKFLDDYWERADVVIDGDAELQQAVRFGMFHAVQAGARAERRPIPAKGLTGPGYDGHVFWDTESYVLPLLTYTMPKAAADALRWRHSILDDARQRAAELGLEGAAFPWRTLHGAEASGYWPAGTAAFHIGADIAEAVARYQAAVDDPAFEREVGVEILVEVARLFRSLGHHDSEGRFRIDGVTGPDEYSALADDNAFTNLMAQLALREAARAVEHHGEVAARFGVDLEEAAAWRDAAEAMHLHYDEKLGVHPQAEGFTEHRVWDFENTPQEHYPLLLHYPYFQLYRTQVVKQADLVMALFKRGDAFTPEEKVRNFRYYEAITVRDSSLSACIQSVVAAETGFLNLAYDYLGEAALMDLDDLEHNTRDGLHIASLAGAWIGVVSGFGGMRDHDGKLTFAPRLPAALQHISFRVTFRGSRLLVDITHDHATYQVIDGGPLETAHHGERFTATSKPAKKPIPPIPHVDDPPQQPAGRAPARRRPLRRERAETTG